MTRSVISLLIVLGGTSAYAKLEIGNIQAAYGEVGPARSSLVYYPGDEILFRYMLTGVQTNDKGEVDIDIAFRLTDAKGHILLDKTTPAKAIAAFAGGCLPGSARATLGETLPPGIYRLRVVAKDKLSGDTASFEREVTFKATTFTSISQRFFLDADRKVPSGASGIVGQTLHFRIGVIGFDRSKGRIETRMDLEILDEKRKEVLARPRKAGYKNEEADSVKEVSLVNFDGFVTLNRVGNFRLRFNFTDHVGSQNSHFEVPLHVTEP
jgi:hypothetical protein